MYQVSRENVYFFSLFCVKYLAQCLGVKAQYLWKEWSIYVKKNEYILTKLYDYGDFTRDFHFL